MESENKINAVIETAMKNLNNLVDVNTVIGKPVKTENGATIVPISKVTMGFMTGGGEYGEIKLFKKDSDMPFAGGSGAVVSLKPAGFLVEEDGKYRLISFASDGYEKLIESANGIIDKITDNN